MAKKAAKKRVKKDKTMFLVPTGFNEFHICLKKPKMVEKECYECNHTNKVPEVDDIFLEYLCDTTPSVMGLKPMKKGVNWVEFKIVEVSRG